ncbi:hypothetical protein BB561_006049 [Smittium simulii]|uniref:Uncharacterized protein n=1 Tax=Smittium simulii TaxID=133385 RepID=A0A2T9Y6W5_9FUNG|nr:hypothetical protein BB561_006049 [Smittium simulii]
MIEQFRNNLEMSQDSCDAIRDSRQMMSISSNKTKNNQNISGCLRSSTQQNAEGSLYESSLHSFQPSDSEPNIPSSSLRNEDLSVFLNSRKSKQIISKKSNASTAVEPKKVNVGAILHSRSSTSSSLDNIPLVELQRRLMGNQRSNTPETQENRFNQRNYDTDNTTSQIVTEHDNVKIESNRQIHQRKDSNKIRDFFFSKKIKYLCTSNYLDYKKKSILNSIIFQTDAEYRILQTIGMFLYAENKIKLKIAKFECLDNRNASVSVSTSYAQNNENLSWATSFQTKSQKLVSKIHAYQRNIMYCIYDLIKINVDPDLWASRTFKEYLPPYSVLGLENYLYNEKILFSAQSIVSGFKIKGIRRISPSLITNAKNLIRNLSILRWILRELANISVDILLGRTENIKNHEACSEKIQEISNTQALRINDVSELLKTWKKINEFKKSSKSKKQKQRIGAELDSKCNSDYKKIIDSLESNMLKFLISFDYSWVEFEREIMFAYFSEEPTEDVRNSYDLLARINEIERNQESSNPTLSIFEFRNTLNSGISLFRFTEFLAKKPNSEDMTFFIIMLSETWIFLEKQGVYDAIQLAEMDSEMIVSLPRVSIVFHIYTKINETIEIMLKKFAKRTASTRYFARYNKISSCENGVQAVNKNSLDECCSLRTATKPKKSVNFINPHNDQILKSQHFTPNFQTSNKQISEFTSPNKTNKLELGDFCFILTVLLDLKNRVYLKQLPLESTWWFRSKKESIETIKENFLNSAIQYFILSKLFSDDLSSKHNILISFKNSLLEYYLIICNLETQGNIEEVLAKFEELKTTDSKNFISRDGSQISSQNLPDYTFANKKSSKASDETAYYSPEFNSIVSKNNAKDCQFGINKADLTKNGGGNNTDSSFILDLNIDLEKLTNAESSFYKNMATYELGTDKYLSQSEKHTTMVATAAEYNDKKNQDFQKSVKKNTENISKNIQNLYREVGKVADTLQTGVYAKPLRTVFQIVHKMNIDSNLCEEDKKSQAV